MRSFIFAMAFALAAFLASSLVAANQSGGQAAGFSLVEVATHLPKGGTNGYDVGASCLVADPRDVEAAFYYDGDEVRRYDFDDKADLLAFDVPAVASADAPGSLNNITDFNTNTGEVWGAFLRFDPSNPERLIFGDSSRRALTELTLSATTRVVTSSRVIYLTPAGEDWAPFDATFLSTGELLLSRGGSIGGDPFNRLTIVDSSTMPSSITDLAELPGYSGPVTVDAAGKLYYVIPQNTAGVTDATHILIASWTSAQIAAAIADPTNAALSIANATSERMPDLAAFSFITQILARQEGGATVIYLGTYGVGIERLDLATPANDSLVLGVINFASLSSFDFSAPSAAWAPNLGPNDNGVATARLFVVTSQWVMFNDQPSCLARLGSDGGNADVALQMTDFTPSKQDVQPYDGTPATTFSLTVTLRDEAGEVIRFGDAANQQLVIEAFVSNGGVAGASVAFASGGGATNAQAGVATFANLAFANAGSYVLRVRNLASTLVLETTFDVTMIGSIAALSVTPMAPKTNQVFGVAIEIRDQNGQRITSGALGSTIVTLASVEGAGAFLGSTAAQAINGVVTFGDFAATLPGLYRLTFRTDDGTLANGKQIVLAVQVASGTGANNGGANAMAGGSTCALVADRSGNAWLFALVMLGLATLLVRRRRLA